MPRNTDNLPGEGTGRASDFFRAARADIGGLGGASLRQVRGLQQSLIEALDQAVAGRIAAGQLGGHVVAGGDLVGKIARVRKGPGDRPSPDVVLQRVEIFRSAQTPAG